MMKQMCNRFFEEITVGDKTYKPEISIGVNSGEIVSGNIGSKTLKRLDYTVKGDAPNVAQRLQSVAKSGQILITEAVFHSAKEYFKYEKNGEYTLKNKSKPIVTYMVIE